MDFEFASMDGGNIVVTGRIDTSYAEDFKTAPIVIAGKSLKVEIVNENPFKK